MLSNGEMRDKIVCFTEKSDLILIKNRSNLQAKSLIEFIAIGEVELPEILTCKRES
jgi:hypothetical protein